MATTGSARRPAKRTGLRRFFNYPRRGKGPVRRWLPSWRIVVGTFLGFLALGSGVAFAAYSTTEIPGGLDSIDNQITTLYYSDGTTPITTIQAETRIMVDLKDLPKYVGDAVIASEDASFRTNMGIDPRGLARALWTNLTTGGRQGGSTLTQQYVERTMTDSETSYLGKIKEMIIAVKVTRTTEKDEILEKYLNTIYWGRNVNGIGAAAKFYFNKPAQELTLSEAALLAGVIPSPNKWDPGVNPDMAKARWTRVMNRMLDQGLITKAEHDAATFPEFVPKAPATNKYAGQVGYIVDMVKNEIGDKEAFADGRLATRGLSVVTTIDKNLQDKAVEIASSAYTADPAANPLLRIGLVSIDPTNGELRTVYGGTDYLAAGPPGGPFNFATQGGAQGGSTFKPFTLLGYLQAGHQLNERFEGHNKMPLPGWGEDNIGPRNFKGQDFGNIDLVEATANSVNAVYAQMNLINGPEKLVEVAHELGIPDPAKDPAHPTEKEKRTPGWIDSNPANVLGTATVRPVDLATAYATLANGGSRVTPHVVRSVTDLQGNLLYTGETTPTRTSFSPENISAVTYAMTQVVQKGSGKTALELDRPVAGKTGTSNDNRSAWFAGFVPQLVTVVGLMQQDEAGKTTEISSFGPWAGKEITGSTFPVRAWTDFMKVALDGTPVQEFPEYHPPRALTPSASPSPEATPSEVPTMEAPTDPAAGLVEVPTGLVGKEIAEVTRTLQGLGLVVVTNAVDSEEPKRTVLAVASEGRKVPQNSRIVVDVSTGRGRVEETPSPEPTPDTSPEPDPEPSASDPAEPSEPPPGTGKGGGAGG